MTLRIRHLAALALALALTLHAAGARAAAIPAEDTPSTSTWIGIIQAAANPNPALPTLWLIGDSTVRNGTAGTGGNGQWGWGAPIATLFDLKKINVVNKAMGGTSSRSYQSDARLWPAVLPRIKSGDFVIMQFGHNDGGSISQSSRPGRVAIASIRGNGDETQAVRRANGTSETVHSFGGYLRQYIADIKSKGATPIVCSLIPRNRWGADGKENRNNTDYALWAAEAAKQSGALFIDLHNLTADYFDTLGKQYVNDTYFTHPANEAVHPNDKGAVHIAGFVVAGVKALKDCKLKDYLAPAADSIKPAGPTELNK